MHVGRHRGTLVHTNALSFHCELRVSWVMPTGLSSKVYVSNSIHTVSSHTPTEPHTPSPAHSGCEAECSHLLRWTFFDSS